MADGHPNQPLHLLPPLAWARAKACLSANTAKPFQKRRINMQKTGEKLNLYQIVTDRIVANLKKGVIPWEKPWKSPRFADGVFPRNFSTGKPYHGINVMLLWGTNYSSPFWLTYKQAHELGGSVRKGERSERIVFYKQLQSREETEQPNEENTESKRQPFMLTVAFRIICRNVSELFVMSR